MSQNAPAAARFAEPYELNAGDFSFGLVAVDLADAGGPASANLFRTASEIGLFLELRRRSRH